MFGCSCNQQQELLKVDDSKNQTQFFPCIVEQLLYSQHLELFSSDGEENQVNIIACLCMQSLLR